MFIGRSFKGFFLVALASLGLASCQTKASSPKATQAQKTSPKPAEVYREVTAADGIRFNARFSSVSTVTEPNPAIPRLSTDYTTAQVSIEGLELVVIGDDKKEIAIPLASPTVAYSQIQTKDFGIIKIEMNSNLGAKFFATESQIKQLRTLVAGNSK